MNVLHQTLYLESESTKQVVVADLIEIFGFGHVRVEIVRVRDVNVQISVIVRSDVHEVGDRVVVQILEPIECEDELNHDEGAGQGDVDCLEMLI